MAEYGSGRDLVSGAIVNDGRHRPNVRYPDKQLGLAAYYAAEVNRFPLGAVGAGRNVWVGGGRGRGSGMPEQAGQGGAFGQFGQAKIAVFTVVSALGAIMNRKGDVACVNLDRLTGERVSYLTGLEQVLSGVEMTVPAKDNTTLTFVITNQTLSSRVLQQVARQIHSSMARAIQPFHTIYDGDVLYMITTGAVENKHIDPVSLGMLASELAWDAILNCRE
jgi:L-aminopeptidase/D-esterase-like protein